MIYVIYFFGVFFILLSIPMLYVFYREKHFGIFLMGVIYSFSGLMAISLPHWWPLLVGFVMVWLMRLLGLEPGVPASMPKSADPQSADTKNTKGTKERQINN